MSIKSTIAAVAASPFLLAGAAFAGPYVNVESNLSYPDGDYSSTATDIHLGYEGTVGTEGKIAYYVQGGPSFVAVDGTDGSESEFSGKAGVNIAATAKIITITYFLLFFKYLESTKPTRARSVNNTGN